MRTWMMIQRVIDLIAEVFGRIGWILLLYCMFLGVTDVFPALRHERPFPVDINNRTGGDGTHGLRWRYLRIKRQRLC